MFKKISISIVMMFTVLSLFADTRQHLIKPGDTLYSIAKKYEVTEEAIKAANPSIEGTTIKAGMTLIIPDPAGSETNEHKKKNNIFSIFKKKDKKDKNNEKQEVVQNNTPSNVPVKEQQKEEQIYQPEQITNPVKRVKQYGAPDNIVVILPFKLNTQSLSEDKLQMRSVEFYEGFLLAVDEAQKAGQRILVQTYDLGTKSMGEILATESLKDADMIIAPMEQKDVKAVAEFGKEHDINVVSPFAFNAELSKDNKNLIQLNTSKNLLYDNLTEDVLTRFKYYEIVFLTDSSLIAKQDPYPAYLQKALQDKAIKFHEFKYGNPEPLSKVDSLLHISGSNILYVSTVNTKEALRKIFPCLKCTTYEGAEAPVTANGTTAILGYPEWVLHSNDFMNYYYDMNVHMFSKFYINPFDEKVKSFYKKFHYWFDKDPMPLTPRYALLGYDVGKYFLAAIRRYGLSFNEHLDNFSAETLQSMMSFEKDGEGWINKGLYLVHFKPSTEIEKYEIK